MSQQHTPKQPQKPPNPPQKRDQKKAESLTDKVSKQVAQDVALTRRRFSIKSVLTWLFIVFLLLVLLVAGIVAFVSTDRGTRYFLETVSDMTNVELNYDKGNLVSGLWLKDIVAPINKNSTLYVDKARVKLGWRQLFDKEVVHLRDAYIHEMTLQDVNPPSGKPFHYFPIKLPIKVVLSKAQVDRFVYAKATRKDVVITAVRANNVKFTDNKLSLRNGKITYGKYASLSNLKGNIVFQDTWPISAKGDLTVPMLSRQQFSDFDTKISGTLAELKAEVSGKWRDDGITGELVAHPVEKRLPYKGAFRFDHVRLPYLKSQNITLSKGALAIKGNLNQTFLGLDADMQGKHFPKGRYLASGRTHFQDITFNQLSAKTDIGTLAGSGYVAWKNGLSLDFSGHADDINPQTYVPKSARKYVPKTITGPVKVSLRQPKHSSSKNAEKASPLTILADISQTTGDAFRGSIQLLNNRFTSLNGQLISQKMSHIPQGGYNIDLKQSGNKLTVKQLNYQGTLGQFNASADIVLPKQTTKHAAKDTKSATTWQANITKANIQLDKLHDGSLVKRLVGNMRANGQILGNSHNIEISAVDASAQLVQTDNTGKRHSRDLALLGKGTTDFRLVNGKLSKLKAGFSGKVDTAGLPAGNMVFDIEQKKTDQGNDWQINQLEHKNADGSIKAVGHISVGKSASAPMSWQLSGQLNNFNPAIFLPAYTGKLSGDLNTQGVWSERVQKIIIDRMNVSGSLKGKPLLASGKLKVDLSMPNTLTDTTLSDVVKAFYADNFRLQWASNQVVATGDHEKVLLKVDISTLHQLYSGISGKLDGAVLVTNPKSQAPNAAINLTAKAFRVGTIEVDQGKLVGKLSALGQKKSELRAQLKDILLNNTALHALDIYATGTQAQHQVKFNAQHNKADIKGLLTGRFSRKQGVQWQGQLTQGQLRSDLLTLNQQQPASIDINTANNQYGVSAHCWRSQRANGSFCLDRPLNISKQGGMVYASLKSLDSAFFTPFLPSGMAWKGRLQGNTRLNWQRGRAPQVNAVFYTDNGTVGLEAEDPQDEDIAIAYKRLSLILASHPKGLKVRMDAKTQAAGNGYIDAVVDPKHPDKTINGAMVLDNIRLDVLRPFFPGVRKLEGTASLAGGMSGPLKGPQYYGNFKLKNGAVAMLGLPVNLRDVNVTSSIRGTKATITGDFLSGTGKGKLTGSADWKNTLAVKLNLSGQRLALRYPPMLYAEVNPDIQLDLLPFQRRLGVAGRVDVVKGTVRAPDSDPNVIKQSSDVVIIHDSIDAKSDETELVIELGEVEKALAAAEAWKINTNVTVKIEKDTYFNGFGASIPLRGQVNIKQSGRGRTQGFGSIDIGKRVPVTVFGQSLDLTRGQVKFAGNLAKPTLDIEAVRKISGDEIGVRVEGSPMKPKIEVFNDAGLTEQQAMNALVTGRIEGAGNTTTETFQDGVNNALAAAGLSVGLRGTRSFTNRIGRNFGLSALTLDASGTDSDTNFNITGYLTPDLYLRYGVGVFTPVNKLTMRYQLSKRVYVEASSAIEKAIDVFYNWRF